MIVLGLDTSGYANAVGVTDGEKVLADCYYEARADSLEKIVVNIKAALETAGLALDDVAGIGVGLGPGSWTGIRVGVTVAKILAYSTGKPVCGVSTLETLAYLARNETSLICPVISAGTGNTVYAAFYKARDGIIEKTGEPYVGDVAGLPEMAKDKVIYVGTGLSAYGCLEGVRARVVEALPNGAAVAMLAAARLERGESDDALSLTPLYLKESTAKAFVNKYSGSVRVEG
jgi:tRNA threonylcarbamoyladenosine biosynthesis protein TsaB